jgi:hypothetical protein
MSENTTQEDDGLGPDLTTRTEKDGTAAGLGPAHRGYVYQDVATAYFLARAIVDRADRIIVDRKEYENDLFDDLTIERDGARIRRQFKSSAEPAKQFTEEAIKTRTSDLRIDDVVRCIIKAGEAPADEYRICTTWSTPADPGVARLLLPCGGTSSFGAYPTKLCRLNVDVIWPEDGELIWKLRKPNAFTREELVTVCARLIIELECPQISLDFRTPGPLQVLLRDVLADQIGVGRYPNRMIRPEDAAISLTYRANLARAAQEAVTPAAALRDLGIRTDFGRVAQKFPIIEEHLVPRERIIAELEDRVINQKISLLVGSPGSGKSWILTRLADECAERDFLVIRHYCYLQPGDDLRFRRITSDVLFGNLVAELVDADPTLQSYQVPRFSAGRDELENLLAAAHQRDPERNILIIVDGLDHIQRVLADTQDVAPAEARIVDEIAELELPQRVSLLLGSQPGVHLAAFSAAGQELRVPEWSKDEIRDLADRLGTLRLVSEAFSPDKADSYIQALHARSAGNPLYATYLCKETEVAIESDAARGPSDVVAQAPPYDENLGGYYAYLVGAEAPELVASVLAFLDFAITRDELTQLCPLLAPQLASVLGKLSPVVPEVKSQGGLRVYHESFRRFILERLRAYPIVRDDVLERISDWLRSCGFPDNSRAYRYLLSRKRKCSCITGSRRCRSVRVRRIRGRSERRRGALSQCRRIDPRNDTGFVSGRSEDH